MTTEPRSDDEATIEQHIARLYGPSQSVSRVEACVAALRSELAAAQADTRVQDEALDLVRQLRDDMIQVCQMVGLDGVTSDFLFKLNRIVDEKYGHVALGGGPAVGFVGPLDVGDWRCPVCGNDQDDPTLHAEGCPTIGTPAQHDPALAAGDSTDAPAVAAQPSNDEPTWDWRVTGIEDTRGTLQRPFEDSGTASGELAGDALKWLLDHGPIWDGLDTSEAFTIEIRPAADVPSTTEDGQP